MSLEFEFRTFRNQTVDSVVLCLAGRGGSGARLANRYFDLSGLNKTAFIGVTPFNPHFGRRFFHAIEWYPAPYSSEDQEEAVSGLENARERIEEILEKVTEKFNVARNKIAILGFSAGAVMSVYTATRGGTLAGVVGHAGAILEPHNVPACQTETPILLTHGKMDGCFDWYERYVPMKNSLVENNYNVHSFEHYGDHWVTEPEIIVGSEFLKTKLGYPKNHFVPYFEDFQSSLKRKKAISPAKLEGIPKNWKPGLTRKFI